MSKTNRATTAVACSLNPRSDRPRGGQMFRRITLAALVAAIAAFVGFYAPTADASSASTQTASTSMITFQAAASNCPGAFNQPWYQCDWKPAGIKTVNKSSSSSHTHIKVQKTTKSKITQYEKEKGIKVVIYVKPNGITGSGCVDPVAKGQIKPGGPFQNSGKNIPYFWTYWQNGQTACGEHIVTINGHRYIKARKGNCGNWILIPIGPAPPHQMFHEVEFRTTSSFTSTYDKWANHSSSSTSTHIVTPFCTGMGWGLTYQNGQWMCFFPHLVPTAQPPATPTPTPTAYCILNGSPYYGTSAPAGYQNVNGVCVAQTMNCTGGLVWDGMECVQISVTCGNVGNNNGGNCNNTPPSTPPTTPTPPKPGLTGLTFPQEIDITVDPQHPTTSPICATVTGLPANHDVVVTFSLNGIGSFQSNTKEITTAGSGSDQACVTFVAPTETGTTSISAVAYDKTTGLSSGTISSPQPFPIVNPNTSTTRPNN